MDHQDNPRGEPRQWRSRRIAAAAVAVALALALAPWLYLRAIAFIDDTPAPERTDLPVDWEHASALNYNVSTARLLETFRQRTGPVEATDDYTGIYDGRFVVGREAYAGKYRDWFWVLYNRGYARAGIGWNGKVFTRHEALALPIYVGSGLMVNRMAMNARLYLGPAPVEISGGVELASLVMEYYEYPWIDYMRWLDEDTLFGIFTSAADGAALGGFLLRRRPLP